LNGWAGKVAYKPEPADTCDAGRAADCEGWWKRGALSAERGSHHGIVPGDDWLGGVTGGTQGFSGVEEVRFCLWGVVWEGEYSLSSHGWPELVLS
jgi:hypothetical protein